MTTLRYASYCGYIHAKQGYAALTTSIFADTIAAIAIASLPEAFVLSVDLSVSLSPTDY